MVYEPLISKERKKFWEVLGAFLGFVGGVGVWCLVGDFNVTRYPVENSIGEVSPIYERIQLVQ